MTARAVSLFSGIGGLDLAVEWHSFEVVAQVERDPHCAAVLARHWPGVPRWGDVRALDPDALPRAELVFGGPPCQPFSTAGKRKVTNDDRWLWPEMARIVRGLRPRLVFVEAPAGLLSPWRDDGRWRPAPVEEILGDLAALGFDAQWLCVRASDVGAPHERERVFVLAYADCGGRRPGQRDLRAGQPDPDRCGQAVAHPDRLEPERARDASELPGPPGTRAGQGPQRQRDGHAAGHGGEALADAAVLGRGEGWPERPARHGHAVAAAGGHAVANADSPRPPRPADGQAAGPRPAAPRHVGELPESRLGRGPDGLPARLDAHHWPAPQGVEQHPWEPPRTIPPRSLPNRVQRMTALGNAVVPQQGALALGLLLARMEAEAVA